MKPALKAFSKVPGIEEQARILLPIQKEGNINYQDCYKNLYWLSNTIWLNNNDRRQQSEMS